MRYRRMPIEIESPEELGYDAIANNLSESSFSDMRLADYGIDGDVSGLLLQYGDHRGLPRLREQIAAGADGLAPDDVIVTAGAAAALFAIATALLDRGDHALIESPNYATNLETPRALGAELRAVELRFEDGWELDLERLEATLRPQTRLVSVTYPHNPTGAMIGRDDARAPGRDRRAPRRGAAAGRRDLSRARLRRSAAGRGLALAAGAQRLVDVEDLRAPGAADRLDRLLATPSSPRPCSPPRSRS